MVTHFKILSPNIFGKTKYSCMPVFPDQIVYVFGESLPQNTSGGERKKEKEREMRARVEGTEVTRKLPARINCHIQIFEHLMYKRMIF